MTILPLRLRDISLTAGGRTLLQCDLEIAGGAATLILGPNGAGKSLFLRVAHGLVEPTTGAVEWANMDHARRQAMVFQKPVMLRRSVQANIAYGLKLHKVPKDARAPRIEKILDRIGLADAARQPAQSLSGGEQQRLALGRAWALEPEILFLDEPTANLDPGATAAVEAIIGDIQTAGTKIVMTTHDLGQAKRLADEIIFMHQGRVVERRGAAAFFAGPESAEANAFLNGELLW